MAFCPSCGNEVSDSSKFCDKCGKPLNSQVQEEQKQIKRPLTIVNKKLLWIVAAVLVVLLSIIIAIVTYRPTLNLDNYIDISYEGYNGYGSYLAHVDWEKLKSDYSGKIKYKKDAKYEYGEWLTVLDPTEAMKDYVKLENNYGMGSFSNGDTITYHWNIDEKNVNKYFKVKLKYKDTQKTLDGFSAVEKVDVFEQLEVSFSGYSPNAELNIKYTGSDFSSDYYSVDKETGLANGDTVTVTIDESIVEDMARVTGKVPERLEKKYDVAGLPSYVTNPDDIPDGILRLMIEQGKDYFKGYVEKHDNAELKDAEYLGGYLLLANDTNVDPYTCYLCTYKLTVHLHDEYKSYDLQKSDEDISLYVAYAYDNLCVNENGQAPGRPTGYHIRLTGDFVTVRGGTLLKTWQFNGAFDSFEKLYNSGITENENKYACVSATNNIDIDESSDLSNDTATLDDGIYETLPGWVKEISIDNNIFKLTAESIWPQDEGRTDAFSGTISLPASTNIEFGDIDITSEFVNNSNFNYIKEYCEKCYRDGIEEAGGLCFDVENGIVTRVYLVFS